MTKTRSYAVIGALMLASALLPASAFAQTNTNSNSGYVTNSNYNANSSGTMSTGSSSTGSYTTSSTGYTGTNSEAVMPVLYNANGQPVNVNTTGALAAGYYYLGTGATQQVYYYGNGVYYNPATGTYGGSAVYDPNGTAGVSLGYSTNVTSGGTVSNGTSGTSATPGVPNTGAGGDATATWITLALAALIVAGGAVYLYRTRPTAQ